ncbi:MAG: glycosyltransferase family 2 protein [Verrucomicrobiota bacterium]|jgi:GT2 family glycosyltransferase
MDLSIIIVNWNSRDYLRKSLQSIYANSREMSFEIIVVDGASYDGCGEMLAREFPAVEFVQSEKNIGFAQANNLGFAQSQGDYVLFLNPDTEVVGEAINTLHQFLKETPNAGIVGSKLLNTDGSVQTSCVQAFPTILNQFFEAEILRRAFPRLSFWGMRPLFSADKKPAEAEMLSGACLMLPRPVFQKCGGFSEDYFLYAEDLDLCYKTRRAGFKNYFVPAAVIIHHGGGSSRPSQSVFLTVLMRESVYRFLKKFRGGGYGLAFRASQALSALGRLALLLILFPVSLVRGEAETARDPIRRWTAILKWTLGLGRPAGGHS